MTLSKLEIQQMLREMNVKFHADETYEALKQLLQQANHRLWLKSVSGNRNTAGGTEKVLVRKRKKKVPPQDPEADSPGTPAKTEASVTPATRSAPGTPPPPENTYRPQAIEKPAPGKPWKTAADGTEPFNRNKKVFESVLRRSGMVCERCGVKSGEGNPAAVLEPFHILPMSRGGEHSIKNVVALCPACRNAMENEPDLKTIKDLKRKTRSKLYDSLQVVKKKKVRTRRSIPNHRK